MEVLNAMDPNNFYLYRHIRLDKDEIFYIGIGRHQKKWKHNRVRCLHNRNQHWRNIVSLNNGDFKSQIMFDDMTQKEAYQKEIELINLYGRSDLGKGTLCNLRDGGEGGFNLSEESKKKIGNANIKRNGAAILRNPEVLKKRKIAFEKAMIGSNNHQYGITPYKAIAASVLARKGKKQKASQIDSRCRKFRKRLLDPVKECIYSSISEVATIYGVSPQTITRQIIMGKLNLKFI